MGSSDSLEGKVIDNYKILRELGRGGMGVVYLATDVNLRRHIAIKFISGDRCVADPSFVKRFELEAHATAKLRHPNIVAIHALGNHEGFPYIVMEHLEGQSLAEHIKEQGRCGLAHALDITRQAAIGLTAAHRQGVIHRDINHLAIFVAFGSRWYADVFLREYAREQPLTGRFL